MLSGGIGISKQFDFHKVYRLEYFRDLAIFHWKLIENIKTISLENWQQENIFKDDKIFLLSEDMQSIFYIQLHDILW